MTLRRLILLLAGLALAAPVAAQTVRADRVTLNTGPCVITSGSAAPNGARVGNVCDTFIQTTTGAIWTKTSGTGTASGWIATLAGVGTPGTLAVWTGSGGSLADSIISQSGGNATIAGGATITGAATLRSNLDVTGAATLRADTSISGNTVLGGWIGSVSYASQVSGWRITNTGAADVRYLFTDELRAKLFTADQETVLAGSERITKSYSTIAQPFTCPALGAGGTLWVFDASTYGDAPVFQTNDWLVIHVLTRAAFGPFTITDCVGNVNTYTDGTGANAGQQSWTFVRGAGASGGAMTGGTVVPVNQLVQDMGVSGNGYVEMSAVDGAGGSNAPYIQTNTWTGAPVAGNTTTQCRLGNLNGITSTAQEFGLLCGTLAGTQSFIRLSNKNVEIRNLPVNLFDAGTPVFSLSPSPIALAMGNPLPTAYSGTGANTGVWMGKDTDSTYKLRIGTPAGNRLTWNGSVLTIAGEGSGITNINGGNIQAGTITASQLNITPAGAALNMNPQVDDPSAWTGVAPSATIQTITDGVAGQYTIRSPANGAASLNGNPKWLVYDGAKSYRLHVWVRAANGANGQFLFGFQLLNAAGAYAGQAFPLSATAATVGTAWHEFDVPVTGVPNGIVGVQPILYMNYTGTAGYFEAQDVRWEEALPSTLIKDGAITTNKIVAGSITGDRIAANTITVGNLNATGFGDNLVKNGTFEGPAAHALDGWNLDSQSTNSIQQACCGSRGPGALLMNNAANTFTLVEYLAVPVQAAGSGASASAYRVALDVFASAATGAGLYVQMLESNSQSMPRYIDIAGVSPNVRYDNLVYLAQNVALAQLWNHFEFVYTPSSSAVHWVSFAVQNNTCNTAGATCTSLYLDAVEMQPQIGAGHIRANSITADRLVANSITSTQIAAGTITSTQIAAGTITGGNIAGGTITGSNIAGRTITAGALVANTITSNEIGVRAIVAGNLAANTITSAEIAAGTITADRMNVSTLSAITANLGAVNAGSLNAVTITGSTITGTNVTAGCATMNSNGITLTAGGGACNWYKFSNGTIGMSSDGGAWMYVQGPNVQIYGTGSGGYLNLQADSILHAGGQVVLDTNGQQLRVTPAGYLQLSLASLPGGSATHLCLTSDGYLQRCA